MDFYAFTSSPNERKLAQRIDPWTVDPIECPLDIGHRRGKLNRGNAVFKLPKSAINDDIIWSWGSDCIVTDRVVERLKNEKVTGIRWKPATCVDSRKCEISNRYQILEPCGWGGYADCGGLDIEVEHCEGCGFTTFRLPNNLRSGFDIRQWDGSDVFRIWSIGYICVVAKVASLLQGYKSFSVKKPETVKFNEEERIGCGKLSEYLPLDKAHQVALREYHI